MNLKKKKSEPSAPLKIAFLWHMHQPDYRDAVSRRITLPWVRLHALKDYYGMVHLLEDFPEIRSTFNLVPCMLEQLLAYCGGEKDLFQDIYSKSADNLNSEEARFLVRHFFSANLDNLIRPFPRYHQLWEKRERYGRDSSDESMVAAFSIAELRDIQLWFQLVHFDPECRASNDTIREMLQKGRGFSESDKRVVAEVELNYLNRVIPEYKRLSETGQIEISTSPFYHPILPLLIDPQEGKRSNPALPDYDLHFSWNEDARSQLEASLFFMERVFGRRPRGIWPSEGSVSQQVVDLMAEFGVTWIATDEEILARSLKRTIDRDGQMVVRNPHLLYRPYKVSDNPTSIFFRDRYLSDLVGFFYKNVPEEEAARDFADRIKATGKYLTPGRQCVIPIILDGENAWEHYPGAGRLFLRELFRLIQEDSTLETVTFSEASGMDCGSIDSLASGSWINGNFDIWIGDEEDRVAWKMLSETRSALLDSRDGLTVETRTEAEKRLQAAEGSDWFWWFGAENHTEDLDLFDALFRSNLKRIHQLINLPPGERLLKPVSSRSRKPEIELIPPSAPIEPTIDGYNSHFFEWYRAGEIIIRAGGGAMNPGSPSIRRIRFGFDAAGRYFFLRLDPSIRAETLFNSDGRIQLHLEAGKSKKVLDLNHPPGGIASEGKDLIELKVPLQWISEPTPSRFVFHISWIVQAGFESRTPQEGSFEITVPSSRDYSQSWLV